MKITISNALITNISTSIIGILNTGKSLEVSHPYVKANILKKAQRHAKLYNVSLEEAKEATAFKLPFTSVLETIKERTDKIGKISKTDEHVEIEFNDAFLSEFIDLGCKLISKTLKPTADLLQIVDEHEIHMKQFDERWNEEEVIDLTHTKLPSAPTHLKINDPVVSTSEWTLKENGQIKQTYFLDEEHEKFIDIFYTYWINKAGQELSVTPTTTSYILSSTNSLLETARKENLPVSLVNVIRAHYNFELLTNTSSTQAEIEQPTKVEEQTE